MAVYIVWTCTNGGTTAAELGGAQRPTCPAGNGSYQAIQTAGEPFDIETLNPDDLAAAFGAGFTVMATGLVIVQAARALLSAFK